MSNRLTMANHDAILQLHALQWSDRRIAHELGIDRGTVARHLRRQGGLSNAAISTPGSAGSNAATFSGLPGPSEVGVNTEVNTADLSGAAPNSNTAISTAGSDVPIDIVDSTTVPLSPTPVPGRRSLCEPYHEVIIEKLKQELTAQRIYQDLVDEYQFVGSYQSVKRFVRRGESKSTQLPMRRMECEPGFEAQVDYGTGARVIVAEGKHRKTNVFRIVLSHSRKGYSEATFRQTTDDFLGSVENAFWYFGGVPQTLVIDNLKAAVKHADWYDPELNPKLRSFCQHYGVAILPTRPYTPRHKGKIERGVGYVKSNSLKARTFGNLADQNEHLAHWEESVADTRIHGTTRKHVGRLFVEVERPALRPLPLERFPFFHEAQRKVSRDGHVEVARAYYSVPPEYLGHTVWVRWDARLVRIFNRQMHQITLHVRHEPGKFSTQPDHIAPEKIHGIERGVEFLMKKVRLMGSATTAWAEAMLVARGIEGTRVLLGVIALTKKHAIAKIEGACRVALSQGEFGVRAIRLLTVRQPEAVQATLPFLDEHPMIRPLDDYAQMVANALRRKSDRVAATAKSHFEPMPPGNSDVRLSRHGRANEFVQEEQRQNPDGENHQGSRDILVESKIHPPGSGYSLPGCSPAEPDSASPDCSSLRPLFPPLPGESADESAE